MNNESPMERHFNEEERFHRLVKRMGRRGHILNRRIKGRRKSVQEKMRRQREGVELPYTNKWRGYNYWTAADGTPRKETK